MTLTPETRQSKRVAVTYEMLRDNEEFADTLYHEGSKSEYFSAFCPWHDDKTVPSLLVYPIEILQPGTHSGFWKCLAGCGIGGLETLYRKLNSWERKDQTNARRKRIQGVSFNTPYLPTDVPSLTAKADAAGEILRRDSELGWYLKDRGLKDRIEIRNLGHYNGWITIPVYNAVGEVETLILRSTPPIQKATGIRFHSPALPPKLYVPNWASIGRTSDNVYVVFGMFDALSLDEIGFPVCCATHGNQSLNPTWFMGSMWRNRKFLLVSDEPAHEVEEVRERCTMMQNLGLNARMLRMVYPDGCKDPNDVLVKRGREGLIKSLIGVL